MGRAKRAANIMHADAGPVSTLQPPERAAELGRRLEEALASLGSVRWAYLFGSAARGERFRDLDVAVMMDENARGGVALGRVVARLEAAVPEVRVDVVDLRSAAPRLAGTIAREGRVLLDRDPRARRLWQLDANRRALDIEPWLVRFERLRRDALEGKTH